MHGARLYEIASPCCFRGHDFNLVSCPAGRLRRAARQQRSAALSPSRTKKPTRCGLARGSDLGTHYVDIAKKCPAGFPFIPDPVTTGVLMRMEPTPNSNQELTLTKLNSNQNLTKNEGENMPLTHGRSTSGATLTRRRRSSDGRTFVQVAPSSRRAWVVSDPHTAAGPPTRPATCLAARLRPTWPKAGPNSEPENFVLREFELG